MMWKGFASLLVETISALKLAETQCVDDHRASREDFNITRELAPICAQTVEMFVLGKNWKTLFTLYGQHTGKISHYVKQRV